MISCNRLCMFFLVQYFSHLTYSQPFMKFFRKDYVYLEEPKAFYKIHTLHKTWDDAKFRCEIEGAKLFYPDDDDEAAAVIEHWNKTQAFKWIFIGVSTPNVKEVFETVDGVPLAEVYDRWGPGEPNDAGGVEGCVVMRQDGTLNDDNCAKKFPFICKKTLASLNWNNHCNIPDTAYEYAEERGRCYKFHLNPMNWTDAYKVCDAEQSYLAVINSDEEAAYLVNLTSRAPKDKVEGNYLRGAVHLGFKIDNNQVWKTIRGTTLGDSGYSKWGGGQPDGGENEKCGSMFYNGHLNDISCGQKLFFICEHEVDILGTSYVLRPQCHINCQYRFCSCERKSSAAKLQRASKLLVNKLLHKFQRELGVVLRHTEDRSLTLALIELDKKQKRINEISRMYGISSQRSRR